MAVPSESWSVITSAQVDADSPLDETLMAAIRGNLIHLEEWLGLSYTAEQDHDHDGSNSSVIAVLPSSVAGTCNVASAHVSGEIKSTTSAAYVHKSRFWVSRSGIWRVYASYAGSATETSGIAIYKNGVLFAETSKISAAYSQVSWDVTGCTVGTYLDFYIKISGGHTTYIKDQRLSNHGGVNVAESGWDETV